MKNLKLTLATTLSVLALTFAGAASADNGSHYSNQKQKNQVTYNKKVTKQQVNNKVTAKKAPVKKVTVQKATPKKTVVTKNVVTKPAKTQVVTNNQYNTKKVVKTNVKKTVKPSTYTVGSGDTLYHISLRTGVSVNKIARLNRLNNSNLHNIRIGQTLRIS